VLVSRASRTCKHNDIVVRALDARGLNNAQTTCVQLSLEFLGAVLVEVVHGIVAMTVAPRWRCDEDRASGYDDAANLRERTHWISKVLDDVEQEGAARGMRGKRQLFRRSMHARHEIREAFSGHPCVGDRDRFGLWFHRRNAELVACE
jgi:hypothetical protein